MSPSLPPNRTWAQVCNRSLHASDLRKCNLLQRMPLRHETPHCRYLLLADNLPKPDRPNTTQTINRHVHFALNADIALPPPLFPAVNSISGIRTLHVALLLNHPFSTSKS